MKLNKKIVIISIVICVLITIIPLAFIKNSEFDGTDDAAGDVISEILGVEEYEPWFSPVYEPPGGETESLFFCLQAAIGAGVIGYGFGTLIERKRKQKRKN